jgi:divinyl chlorophyllide a 8-vinyl-reductase
MIPTSDKQRIFLLGATGTIGQATARALVLRGYEVVSFVRWRDRGNRERNPEQLAMQLAGTTLRFGDVADIASLERDGFKGERFDAVVSCIASRSGVPRDAWAVDYSANCNALAVAKSSSVTHFVLLSAICVQKPLLAFQRAKLAFEKTLIESGIRYSIVRPTAFFKSLSGQVERVKRRKPFLVFGNGQLTACKPISDSDLANYLLDCLGDPSSWNRILPVGGPGRAITPQQQGERLFSLLGQPARFQKIPVRLLDVIIALFDVASRVLPALADKAELARIARYYATESMLVLNSQTGLYEESATPSIGTETLFDFYSTLIHGAAIPDRGDHAVF